MKYYETHEQEYKRRLRAGQVAWDEGDYEQFDMLPLIQKFLKETRFDTLHPRALDLGCGTGALATFLSKKGFNVTAIDISPSAINEARKQAKLRNVEVDFCVADVCQIKLPENSFDLIIDNHFLHCIIFEKERQKILRKIQRIMKPDGQYWIETMVGHPDMKPRPEWHLDSEGITWIVADESKEIGGSVKKDGQTWCPIRRIRNSPEILADEIRNAGLEIVWQETVAPANENDTGAFRARCCK